MPSATNNTPYRCDRSTSLTDEPGLPDTRDLPLDLDIEDGQDGLLVPAGDSGALATAILQLAEDRPYATRLGRQAYVSTRQRFGLERMVGETLLAYDEALALHTRRKD